MVRQAVPVPLGIKLEYAKEMLAWHIPLNPVTTGAGWITKGNCMVLSTGPLDLELACSFINHSYISQDVLQRFGTSLQAVRDNITRPILEIARYKAFIGTINTTLFVIQK